MCQTANERDVRDVSDSDWKFEREFAERFFSGLATPRALAGQMFLQAGDFKGLLGVGTEPSRYQEPRHFAEDYQVVELLSKSQNIPGVADAEREASALSKFLECEECNAITNARLMDSTLPPWFGEFSHQLLRILGPLGEQELEQIATKCGFGPGANIGVRTSGLVPSIKYEAIPVGTARVLELLPGLMPAFIEDYWGVNLLIKSKSVAGNSHFTVPKKWNIKRCAAKEPLWNSYLQAGIGGKIQQRLKLFGVDLQDQRWNQYLAERALDWGLATIDLSSASDMLCRTLVWLALCYNNDAQGQRWYNLLCTARSPKMKIEGEWRALEMFASMGNGFTFPLETAIFLALIRCTVPKEDLPHATAYGDDIIVPQRYAACLIERLEYIGFKPNHKKTCLAGTFFESCGTDWFNGQNVRPFYLHKDPENPAPYPLRAANALRAWCHRVYGSIPPNLLPVWKWCKSRVPQSFRNPVPSWLGDVGLHVDLETAIQAGVQRALEWEGYVVTTARFASVFKDRQGFGVIAAALAAGHADEPLFTYGKEAVRGLYGKVCTKTSVVPWEEPPYRGWLPS